MTRKKLIVREKFIFYRLNDFFLKLLIPNYNSYLII